MSTGADIVAGFTVTGEGNTMILLFPESPDLGPLQKSELNERLAQTLRQHVSQMQIKWGGWSFGLWYVEIIFTYRIGRRAAIVAPTSRAAAINHDSRSAAMASAVNIEFSLPDEEGPENGLD